MSRIKEILTVNKVEGFVEYESFPIDKYEVSFGDKALSHGFVLDCFRKLMGKTLTILDASIAEPKQNKAMKDLVRNVYSEEMEFLSEIVFDQKSLQNHIDKQVSNMGVKELGTAVEIEEVLGVK